MSKDQALAYESRFFFDISELVNYIGRIDRYSGIQRVVVTAIVETSELVDESLLFLSWRDKKSGQIFCVPYAEIGRAAFTSPASMRRIFRPDVAKREPMLALQKYRTQPVRYYVKRTWLDLQAALGRDHRFRKYNLTAITWRAARKSSKRPIKHPIKRLDFHTTARAGDDLVLLDSSWSAAQIDVFTTARNIGMRVHSMVYDLIPVIAPEVCEGHVPAEFHNWLLNSATYTDRYMVISQSAGRDLQDFFKAYGIEAPVNVVPLAQAPLPNFETATSDDGPLRSQISKDAYPNLYERVILDDYFRQILAEPYVLCVGTLEARKNVWRIAMAWKSLLDQGHVDLPKLVFAGRRGWLRSDFEDLLKATSNLYGYIRVIEGPSDKELDMLYRHCVFAIMASTYEGWGLPVGEALAYGKTAVVGDNSSLPEVGGDLVEYCDARSVASISQAIENLLDPHYRTSLENKIAQTELRSWNDVARDLLKMLQAPDRARAD